VADHVAASRQINVKDISMAAAPTRQAKADIAPDAVALLKADHRQVKEWFEEFEGSRSAKKKKQLATNICNALTVHTKIEEEIFYPAFLAATKDKDMHHEAVVEHAGAKVLIAQIEASDPSDDYYDSKVHVLSEMIKHYVKEEEQKDGMFAEAKQARKMDLEALGEQMFDRKTELMAQIEAGREILPNPRRVAPSKVLLAAKVRRRSKHASTVVACAEKSVTPLGHLKLLQARGRYPL
jgi:hemerythrin superfamily protein